MIKLNNTQYTNIYNQIVELPFVDDLDIENTESGLVVMGSEDDLSIVNDTLVLDDNLDMILDGDKLIISSKTKVDDTQNVMENIYVEIYKNKSLENLQKFDTLLRDYVSNINVSEKLKTFGKIHEDDGGEKIDFENGYMVVGSDKIDIIWNDGSKYVISNIDDNIDIDKLILILGNNDSVSDIIDELAEIGYILDSVNETFTKDEIYKILEYHNISGKKLDVNKINNVVINEFNSNFVKFITKHPNFDIFGNSVNTDSDDEFVNMLIEISTKNGMPIC